MKKDELRFEIDQIRKDKIIYATEACATVLICILVFLFSNIYFPRYISDFVNISVLVIAISYSLFMGVGNYLRLKKIFKLQRELNKI